MTLSSPPPLETRLFKMGRSRLITTLLYLYCGWAIMTLVVVAISALLAGIFVDLRWAVVFLMILFLIAPFLMVFLYFYHGLRPSTALNVVEHYLIFKDEGIIIRLLDKIEPEDNDSVENTKWTVRYEHFYPFRMIDSCISGSNGYIIRLRKPESGFIWLQYDAFKEPSDLNRALQFINNGIRDKRSIGEK